MASRALRAGKKNLEGITFSNVVTGVVTREW